MVLQFNQLHLNLKKMKIENEFEKKWSRKNSFTTLLYYCGSYYDNENLIEKVN